MVISAFNSYSSFKYLNKALRKNDLFEMKSCQCDGRDRFRNQSFIFSQIKELCGKPTSVIFAGRKKRCWFQTRGKKNNPARSESSKIMVEKRADTIISWPSRYYFGDVIHTLMIYTRTVLYVITTYKPPGSSLLLSLYRTDLEIPRVYYLYIHNIGARVNIIA